MLAGELVADAVVAVGEFVGAMTRTVQGVVSRVKESSAVLRPGVRKCAPASAPRPLEAERMESDRCDKPGNKQNKQHTMGHHPTFGSSPIHPDIRKKVIT